MKDRGRLIVISGPSGSGKSSVVFGVMEHREDLCFSISVTTREPREGEVDGREYFFIDEERFAGMVERGELLEHARYVSHSYGTPRAFVEQRLAEGMNVILDIEVQGARQVCRKFPDAVTVFILPPSMKALRERLLNRGTDSAEVVESRVNRAKEELREADFYDYMIINDDLGKASAAFEAILNAEHCRFDRAFAESFLE